LSGDVAYLRPIPALIARVKHNVLVDQAVALFRKEGGGEWPQDLAEIACIEIEMPETEIQDRDAIVQKV
jgi:hypothetical protein